MIAIENSRWKATTHGLRSVSTVMPPSTACAGTLSASQRASRRRSRRPDRHALTNVAIAIAVSTNVRVRLPNSIAECTSRAPCGVNELPWQRGQVGQPSPEPVEPHRAAGEHDADVGDERGPAQASQPGPVAQLPVDRCSLPREGPRGEYGADDRPRRAAPASSSTRSCPTRRRAAGRRRGRRTAAAARPRRTRRTPTRGVRRPRRPAAAGRPGSPARGSPRHAARPRRTGPARRRPPCRARSRAAPR